MTDSTNTPRQVAIRALEDAVIAAVASVTQLAAHGESEKLRFEASTYIIDRVLGDAKTASNRDVFDDLLERITASPNTPNGGSPN